METARAIVADLGRTPPPLSSSVRVPAALSRAELVWSLLDMVPDAVLLCDRDSESCSLTRPRPYCSDPVGQRRTATWWVGTSTIWYPASRRRRPR
jgi:hypothetical protein